jgi:superfamily II DNA or RNA helicase
MELRERQNEAIHGGEFGPGILKCWDESWSGQDATGTEITGGQSTLVVAATGFGKTVLFAAVADLVLNDKGGRVVLLTHRDKLLWQARDTFAEFGRDCDVEMGEYKVAQDGLYARDVLLMTVQTGRSGKHKKRFEKFNPEDYSLCIVDEAHHSVSNEFLECINHFKKNPKCKVLGVTATPDRHDEKALRTAFDSVAYVYGLQRAINDGWLCPIQVQYHELEDYDLSNVDARGGDFIVGQLENELLKHVAPCAQKLYEATREELTLHFCAGVHQAIAMSDALNAIRPGIATYLLGNTPDERRVEIYQNFVPDGSIRYLVNVGVATEGFDQFGIQNISLDRPTKSRPLFEQMIGRGSRLWEGLDLSGGSEDRKERIALSPKPVNKIHDFVGASGRHKLVTVSDILGGNERLNSEVSKRIREAGKPADVAQMMVLVAKEFEEQERVKRAREFQKGKATYRTQFIDPFNLFQVSDTRSSRIDGCVRLSEKQINFLRNAGYEPSQLSSTQGKQLIGKLMERRTVNLATPKQVRLLRDKGVPEADKMSFENASRLITRIADNHWRFSPSMLQGQESEGAF